MASYKLEFKPSAERELTKLPRPIIPRIVKAIDALLENPFPRHGEKLSGSDNAYRIRIGEYRVIYTVERSALVVTVIRVGHRREVYRKR